MIVDAALITHLEKLALAAWPAEETVWLGGWAMRATQGFTKRANSANAMVPQGAFVIAREAAEAFYDARGLPTIFRLTPLAPVDTDDALAMAGYMKDDPSRVMIAALGDVAGPTAELEIGDVATKDWLDGFAAANSVPAASRHLHDGIIKRIVAKTGFARLTQEGRFIGYGLAVRDDAWLGLFDLVIAPDFRGKGYGKRLLKGLMAWGFAQGARHAYLQVREVNSAARRLYAGCGFTDAYAYHYRIRV